MKKELLMATALVSTLGAASVAQAVTATMAGSMKVGAEFESPDSGVDTNNVKDQSNFNISLSETTDGGTTISTSFEIVDEGTVDADDDNAIKLTFTDGSALELLNAGNAAGTHAVSVPGASGEQGIGGTSTNNAPTDLDFAAGNTALGVEWHSAADFLADGLKFSASFSTDSGAAKTATAKLDNSWGVGATYVTSAGDTTITIGGGIANGEIAVTGNQPSADKGGFNFGVSAVTGDLTVGVGYADGDTFVSTDDSAANTEVDGSVVKAGIKYVTGDITLALGVTAGEAKDSTTFGTADTIDDSNDSTSASITYAVASGVSAVLGYTTVDRSNDGVSSTDDGSAWYVGATMSF
ncbi:MAG: porin [Proteobacteria bacterium]|nr:porin [Pseudomonadota bacterium]MDA1181739.1 porin [Pseudomonadota bacterium]